MKKKIIGRTDIARFPDLGIDAIAVKIDTGAFTSSIHCHEIEVIEENGDQILQFRLLDPEHEQYHDKQFQFNHFEQRVIKNSFGESETRYIIKTQIELFQEMYQVELSLTNRGNMKFPVLLGRKILAHFLVDVSAENLSFTKSLEKVK